MKTTIKSIINSWDEEVFSAAYTTDNEEIKIETIYNYNEKINKLKNLVFCNYQTGEHKFSHYVYSPIPKSDEDIRNILREAMVLKSLTENQK